jgi:hypothetical protein
MVHWQRLLAPGHNDGGRNNSFNRANADRVRLIASLPLDPERWTVAPAVGDGSCFSRRATKPHRPGRASEFRFSSKGGRIAQLVEQLTLNSSEHYVILTKVELKCHFSEAIL